MKVLRLEINNFRGIEHGRVDFRGDTLLVGGNNVGKSSVCEALDLVLGPERLYRRPAVDEHDFYRGCYLDEASEPVTIEISAVLIALSDEARRKFNGHLRLMKIESMEFIDEDAGGLQRADEEGVDWVLPLLFQARYDRVEDDFEAKTFFAHPRPDPDDLSPEEEAALGHGRSEFSSANKRLCGFVFLRALRTGSRALGLQRGSLLDTILRIGGDDASEMWLETLAKLRDLEPAVGDIPQLSSITDQIRERLGMFVNLSEGADAAGFYASDLTRAHLRDVVRLFVATSPSNHPVPFARQGTGSINLLVFALLTMIADLKGSDSVIFAMEEPEIALPPHTQRRVTGHVKVKMGQTIVTSHSPYVIEQFEPNEIVMLHRETTAKLVGTPVDSEAIKPKTFRTERRQFAEAILSRCVIVVEGQTETSLLPAASSVLENDEVENYEHLDFAGVSVFCAGNDRRVAKFGPIFRALGKPAFGVLDKQAEPLSNDEVDELSKYEMYWESEEAGIEKVLVNQLDLAVLRRFLDHVVQRDDYPSIQAPYVPGAQDDDIRKTAFKALKARKGDANGYARMLIEQCASASELPEFLVEILTTVNTFLTDDGAVIADSTEEGE